MTAPDTQPQGDTRTLAEQIRACADAVTVAALLDRRHVVAATLRDLADRAAETELRADRAENARDQVGEMLHTAQEQRNQASARWHEERKHAAEAERERDLLRNALTVIRMIVEESATNDADLLRQAILEQLPPAVPVEGAQGGAESNAGAKCAHRNGTRDRHVVLSAIGSSPEFLERSCSHAATGAHRTPKETGTGTSPVERADEGDPDGPESPQSHAEAPGRENARDDGPEPGSVALVPAVTASGGFGDGGPHAKVAEQ